MPILAVFLLTLVLLAHPPCAAQMQQSAADPQFEVSTNWVQVAVRVRDEAGILTGLKAADFVIFDEHTPQKVIALTSESAPIDLVILLDTSGSMRPIALGLADSALSALSVLHRDDRISLMTFEGKATLRVPFTEDRNAIVAAIRQVAQQPHAGPTNLYRALIDAARYLQHESTARGAPVERKSRVILMLTDGVAGRATLEQQTARDLLEANATVDAMILGPTMDQYLRSLRRPQYVVQDIRRIAEYTGGDVISAAQAGTMRQILERSRLQYTLYYAQPVAPPDTFRRILVELAPAVRQAHPTARVRARTGYYSRALK